MSMRKILALRSAAGLVAVLTALATAADPVPPAPEGTLIIIDAAGREQKLKTWEFVAGTRPLSWLVPAAPPKVDGDKPKEPDKPREGDKAPAPPAGPEALAFRDENSTTFVDGVLTLVPLDRIRSIDYEEDAVWVHVATGDRLDDQLLLKGETKFKGINKLTIEAEVDKGDLGVAEVKFLGGVPKGIRGVRFPTARAGAASPKGRPATVTVADGDKRTTQEVSDLQPLYHLADGGERLLSTLLFKKTLKVDVGKIQKLRAAEGKEAEGTEWGVTLKDAEEETYTLLHKPVLDGKPATLEGFVARVSAGYKLFPPHTVAEIQFDAVAGEPKP
jgi:hypothetical protein